MRPLLIAVSVLFAAGLALAAQEETLPPLEQQAIAAREADQPKLFLELAERQLKAAEDAFNEGQAEQVKAAVEEVADYCQKAGEAAAATHRHLKHTEIAIRALSRRLDAMRRALSFEDRAPLAAAIERMEMVRTYLLNTMFEPK
jgi:Tfp pilus assembly protein PilX